MRAAALAVLALACGCVSAPPRRPDIEVVVEPDARGATCGAEPELVLGGVPAGSMELARVRLTSRPRPLTRYRRALVELARARCAQGVSLLNAEEESGGVVRAEAALWIRSPEGPAP